MNTSNTEVDVDKIIERLLEFKPNKGMGQVNLPENDIKGLCLAAREIFMNQPVLLELEAPIKICGNFNLASPYPF